MTTTLITGGNKGLGYETARRLEEAGQRVIIGARSAERGRAAADALGVACVPLDVTSDASVARAAEEVTNRFGVLDVLINNAGIAGGFAAVGDVDGPAFARVLDTNTIGAVRVIHAFLPLLRRSEHPVIVNVGSGLGSFSARADERRPEHRVPSLAYSASKAALHMLTTIYAENLPGIRVVAVDPGPSATDLTGGHGRQTVTEGTDAVVTAVTVPSRAPSGSLTDRHGPLGW